MDIKEFKEMMLDNVNMFASSMEISNHPSETMRQWMDMFLRWCEWGTKMDKEYWGLTKPSKYGIFDSEPE